LDNQVDQHPDEGRENGSSRVVIEPPPIDMDHLAKQTLGDNGIAREVLGLFLMEIGAAREVMRTDAEAERRDVAHRLKGAARAIGAFSLAESAACVEDAPSEDRHVADFLERVGELEAFIASFGR
jgi:HPt (histidine-containing phosphotransfer) domain-containing protein